MEKNDGGCVGESGLVFDPGEDPARTSGTRAGSDHLGLDDEDGTVLAVGDAYGEERVCGMVQCETSIGGSSGEILEEDVLLQGVGGSSVGVHCWGHDFC